MTSGPDFLEGATIGPAPDFNIRFPISEGDIVRRALRTDLICVGTNIVVSDRAVVAFDAVTVDGGLRLKLLIEVPDTTACPGLLEFSADAVPQS